jgi:hypothetical protein
MLYTLVAALSLLLAPASAFAPPASLAAAPRTAVVQRQVLMVAKSEEDKQLLAASKKVVLIAKRFGVAQGKGAQAWIEQAVKGGDARTESLVNMQLALFEECSLDDESGKCKQLTEAMEAMTQAVEKRKDTSFFKDGVLKPSALSRQFGTTAVQAAATKLRSAATKFGPEQKAVADAWIKKAASGDVSDAGCTLLEEQITLFGECVLSEDGTPSNCQLLTEALESFQEALDTSGIESTVPTPAPGSPEARTAEAAAPPPLVAEQVATDYGQAPEGYEFDRFGRLILTKMGAPTIGNRGRRS